MKNKLFSTICAVILLLTPLISVISEVPFSANAAVSALWPVSEEYDEITTYFDPNRNNGGLSGHNAIDIAAPQNAEIYAPYAGECVSACWMDDYGNLIILWHEELGVYTFYAHCSSMAVYPGQTTAAGDVIGYVGNTGVSNGPHLHFGICDTLINGWPDIMYYDPLTYFSYNKSDVTDPSVPTTTPPTDSGTDQECSCSEEYKGIYITKNIESYLNVRSGHGSEFESVGKIYPNEKIIVTKADGKWAHIIYGSISGYCSMDYIQRFDDAESGMSVTNVTAPSGVLEQGKAFSVGGIINSDRVIARVTGGIYQSDAKTPVYIYEEKPWSMSFDLSRNLDNSMLFNKLECGNYVFKVEAEDDIGTVYEVIYRSFEVGKKAVSGGDFDGNGEITVSDAVILSKIILGESEVTPELMKCADLNSDSVVDFCDMIIIRKILLSKNMTSVSY